MTSSVEQYSTRNNNVYFIISAGFSGAEASSVLNYSAKSATASLADQAIVADTLTSMMNAYKDSNISAAVAANDLTKINNQSDECRNVHVLLAA